MNLPIIEKTSEFIVWSYNELTSITSRCLTAHCNTFSVRVGLSQILSFLSSGMFGDNFNQGLTCLAVSKSKGLQNPVNFGLAHVFENVGVSRL